MVDTLRELTSGVLAQLNYCIEMGNGAVGVTCNFSENVLVFEIPDNDIIQRTLHSL